MYDGLVMLLIENEKVAVDPLRGLGRADPLLIENNLDLAEIGSSRPDLENHLTNVQKEVHSTLADEKDIIGVVALHVDVFSIIDFQRL